MLTLNHVGYETDDNKEILRDINLTIQIVLWRSPAPTAAVNRRWPR